MNRFDIILGIITMAIAIGVLGGLHTLSVSVRAAPEGPPGPPQAPTVTTHRDAGARVTCWLAHSPHGVGISCLQDAPVFTGQRTDAPGVFVP